MTKPGARIRAELAARAERGDVYAPECPSRALLNTVTSRWGTLVLVLLLERSHRFSEIASLIIDVSDKMLSQTLKQLVADGFVERLVDDGPPVRVTYALTPAGEGVATRLADLVEWIEGSVSELVPTG